VKRMLLMRRSLTRPVLSRPKLTRRAMGVISGDCMNAAKSLRMRVESQHVGLKG
jgi:hypothetical protein